MTNLAMAPGRSAGGTQVDPARAGALGLFDRILFVSLCFTVFLLPLEGAVSLGGSSTLTVYVGTLGTVAFLASLVFEQRPIYRAGVAGRSLFFWIAFSALGLVFWTQDLVNTQRQFPLLLRLSLLSIMVFQVAAGDAERRKVLCRCFAVGTLVAAVLIFNNWNSEKTFLELQGGVQTTIRDAGVGASRRYTVGRLDPNYVALLLGVGLCMSWASLRRRLAMLTTPVFLMAIVLTGSRTSLVAGFVAALYYFTRGVFVGRQTTRLLLGALVAIAALAFSWRFVPEDTQVRAKTVLSADEDASANSRRDAWADGVSAWTERPVLGSGLATFLAYTSTVTTGEPSAAHSLYINQLVEGGLVGVCISIYGLAGVWLATGGERVRPERLAIVWWAVTGVALDLDLNKLTFVLLPLCLTTMWAPGTKSLSAATPERAQRD